MSRAASSLAPNAFRAVLFDLGGVVLGSPLHAIARFERERGIEAGFVNRIVAGTGPTGAWSRLERGELAMEAFYGAFEAECSEAGVALDARAMMERVHAESQPRPAMIEAIRRIRSAGLRTGAVTNNWVSDEEGTRPLRPWFDVFVESCVVGVRKPDRRIYEIACREIGHAPEEAVFLDDIGANLKSARAFGLTTIKVDAPEPALRELEGLLGLSLLDAA
ncbi:MAG TPA: HAD family phosphatase [Myxococcota bacterium]|jgi:epoxide hydrolase-like predicted phosphatase|nr:HAD family phosphatase [Myxococcota bacterium]